MASPPHSDTPPCPHEECTYLRGHGGPTADRCRCGGTRHAVASNWDAYSFGHSGGHVAFLTACPSCGRTDTGHVLGVEWSMAELRAADEMGRRTT